MIREQFPLCCGAILLYGFQEHRQNIRDTRTPLPPIIRTPTLKEARDYVEETVERANGRPIFVVLTEYQRHIQEFGPLLEKAGFKVNLEWRNPGTANLLTLFIHTGPVLRDED